MADLQTKQSAVYPRIKLIPKHPIVARQHIVVDNVEHTKPDTAPILDSPPLSPREINPNPMNPIVDRVHPPTSETSSTILSSDIFMKNTSDESISTKRIIYRVIVAGTVILLCSAAIIVPTVLFANLQQKSPNNTSNSNVTSSMCASKTCIGSETPYRLSTITALFPFDGNANDLYGKYIGFTYGLISPSYPGATSYVRLSIELRSNQLQYVKISPMNFRQQSFTLQLWYFIYGSGSSSDYGLFSQCSSDWICLSLSVRSNRLFFSLDSMNPNGKVLVGRTVIASNYWYHVTIAYDAVLRQQSIYLNGNLDAVSIGEIDPYQGATLSANAYIGLGVSMNFTSSYFYGVIDHVTISIGTVRTACQIYNDAGLFVNYPFDTVDTLIDRSVNMIHGISSRLTTVLLGRKNQAIAFESNTSYFQAQSFPTLRYDDSFFSLVLWINPSMVIGGGSLVHVSTFQNGTGAICYDLLGFTASGVLMAQWMTGPTSLTNLTGRILPLNTWSHIALIYSLRNGIRLYINGQLLTAIGAALFNTISNNYITLGNNSPGLVIPSSTCLSSLIVAGRYRGAIDEFRIYMRELNMDELCVLVNI